MFQDRVPVFLLADAGARNAQDPIGQFGQAAALVTRQGDDLQPMLASEPMRQALQQMNVQPPPVLSDISAVTGIQIIRASVACERGPVQLARVRQPGRRSREAKIAKALTGHWRAEHVFALPQALGRYDACTAKLAACDRQIERYDARVPPRFDLDNPEHPLGPDPKPHTQSLDAQALDVRGQDSALEREGREATSVVD